MESSIHGALASLVMPLLDSTPLETQLRVGRTYFPAQLRLTHKRAAPPWVEAWLSAGGDALGSHLGKLCAAIATPSRAAPELAVPAPVAKGGSLSLVARTVLLRGAPLLRNLLTLHTASLAMRTVERTVRSGEPFCRPGEAYVVIGLTVRSTTYH